MLINKILLCCLVFKGFTNVWLQINPWSHQEMIYLWNLTINERQKAAIYLNNILIYIYLNKIIFKMLFLFCYISYCFLFLLQSHIPSKSYLQFWWSIQKQISVDWNKVSLIHWLTDVCLRCRFPTRVLHPLWLTSHALCKAPKSYEVKWP